MTYTHQFSVLPGDNRQEYLIDALLQRGAVPAYDMPLPSLCQAAPVILGGIPFNYTFHELSLTSGQLIFGGCFSEDFLSSCQENAIKTVDYMADKELTVQNAIATAEGTVAEMITHSPRNLHGSTVLIFGFGVCAKALALRLSALHMDVCICARNPVARTEAVSMGYDAIPFSDLRGRLPGFFFLINTVPAQVLSASLMPFIHPECLLLDIASAPGGIDKEAAKELSLTLLTLPGLPGRYSPFSCARFMADCIFKNLQDANRIQLN